MVDPRDSKVVYVAAEGPLWGPGGDRGLYKTTDGGKTWKAVLTISENTGVVDVAIDPSNPDILYASAYQRRRHVFTLIDGGPESAIYKSTDAGATWNKLKSGLPTVDMGTHRAGDFSGGSECGVRHGRSGGWQGRNLPVQRQGRNVGAAERVRFRARCITRGSCPIRRMWIAFS